MLEDRDVYITCVRFSVTIIDHRDYMISVNRTDRAELDSIESP